MWNCDYINNNNLIFEGVVNLLVVFEIVKTFEAE